MAGFVNNSPAFYNPQAHSDQYYEDPDSAFENLRRQQLDFQAFGYDSTVSFPKIFTPKIDSNQSAPPEPEGEPTLLEELEIYPERIFEKTCAVLNPFRAHALADDAEFLTEDTDLGGPICFCLLLAVCLFLSGSKAHFGYIYGLSVLSCCVMYFLLSLMTMSTGTFTVLTVASVLGYCLLPIVVLSVLGVFLNLHSTFGFFVAVVAVAWSSLSASRLFVAISGDKEQRPLIAYPCALVCAVFALLVVF